MFVLSLKKKLATNQQNFVQVGLQIEFAFRYSCKFKMVKLIQFVPLVSSLFK